MTPTGRGALLIFPDLVRRAKKGDRIALAELLDAHAAQAYRLALHILRNQADAEDAVQNASIKAFTNLGRFDELRPFAPWFLRIVTREALNLRRAEMTRFAFWRRQVKDEISEELVEQVIQVKADHRDLWRAVNRLKAIDRIVLTLSYFMEMSEGEVAQILGIKRGAVKKRKHTALVRLRAVVVREFPGLGDTLQGQQQPKGSSP